MYTSIYYNPSKDQIRLVFIENGWIKVLLDSTGFTFRADENKKDQVKIVTDYLQDYELIGNFKG